MLFLPLRHRSFCRQAETASKSNVKVPDPTVVVNAKGEKRIRAGHPWVYRSDIADVVGATPGAVVEVRGPRSRMLGHALFSDQSQITIRMISRDEAPIDDAFWRARLEAAIQFRDTLQVNATAFRLVHGEADLLPSLIVDRYDDYLVMQTLSQGMDRLTPTLVRLLVDLTGEPKRIVGAIVPRDGRYWFYKMMGDAAAVTAAKDAFVSFSKAQP